MCVVPWDTIIGNNGHNMGICATISKPCGRCDFGKECQSCSTCISCLKTCVFFTVLRQSLEHTSGHFAQQHLLCRPNAGSTFKVLAIPEVSLSSGLSGHKKSGPNMDLGLGWDKWEVYYLFNKTAVNKYSLEHQSKKQVCGHFVFKCASLIESCTCSNFF